VIPQLKDLKVIDISSGYANTAVLIEKDNIQEFIIGKFAPLY